MEHIIQFGVTVDDDAIIKHVEEKASEAVVKEIKANLGISKYYAEENVVRKIVQEEVDKCFENLQDKIIAETARLLVDKLIRTKKVKEAVQKVMDETLGG